ncbi:phage tail protein [Bordetella avium]|uniref:phage tail protein n=1 Tax=Bordetella avium TaxID=521 RepID=UPI000FDA476C|nr:phage tail protein [Bordetella avium]AZY50994.1 phage tail protein [Bordetella avium]
MAVRLPNGAIFSIAKTYAALMAVTAVTNADPAVVTAAGHGAEDGSIVEMTSGWTALDGRIARVDASAADSLALEGIDTTDTQRYPVGTGVGGVRPIIDWTQISQVMESASQGGEQQFYSYSFFEDTGDERQIPTTRSARSITLTIADDDTLPHYPVLKAANDDREPRAIRFQLPNGSVIYFRAYVSFSEMPTTTKNEAMTLQVTLSLTGAPTRYKA